MRNTSTQLIVFGGVQLAPSPVIFHTLPWPVTPSLVQRFPSRSKATPLAPGTPMAKVVAVGGVPALGVKVQIFALAPSATKRSPMSLNAIPSGVQGVGSLPTKIKDGLELAGLMLQTGQNVSPREVIAAPPV